MVKWFTIFVAMVTGFIQKYPLLSFLIGSLVGAFGVEICFLISCIIFGYPVNWPVEFPWQFLMK